MTSARPQTADEQQAPAPDGLSAFLARVLDQLSLSAWLPATFLAAAVAVLLRLRAQDDLDVGSAVRALADEPVELLVVTVPVVVLATLVTQSFSFEAIRALEGYWQRRWVLGAAHRALVALRLRHKRSLASRLLEARRAAFSDARASMLERGLPREVVDAIEADVHGLDEVSLDDTGQRMRRALAWRDYGNPVQVSRYDRLRTRLLEYPSDGLVMPTQLGNVMRATEASLRNAGGDVSSFGLRRRHLLGTRVQAQHDQFRTRLDMYCTLVFVALVLAVAAPLVLWEVSRPPVVGLVQWLAAPAVFLVLALSSYRAAVASARGYCVILRVMDRIEDVRPG